MHEKISYGKRAIYNAEKALTDARAHLGRQDITVAQGALSRLSLDLIHAHRAFDELEEWYRVE